jgi:aspartyl-tRNA(Asn)/glutamyl-tRNA(Gln) amidotransferase subunit C
MALAPDAITRLAWLARIDIDRNEARDVKKKLDAILRLIDDLQAIDTADIVPMSHAQDVMLALRDDVVTETDQHERFQREAPAVFGGLYLVPKVIE